MVTLKAGSPQFNTEISGDLLKKLGKAGDIGKREINQGLADASGFLWQKSIEEAPKNTGTLAKSIQRELTPHYARIGPSLVYGSYVHGGTRPHGIPAAELKPGGSLYRWAVRRGISPYAVAKSIARKGTKANPWLTNAMQKYQKDIFGYFEAALNRITNLLGD